MPVVACPKCKSKFKLATEQLGKSVRCSSCQTKFRTAAPASGGAAPSAKPKDKAKSKTKRKAKPASAPPAKKTPRTLEDELFSSAPLKAGAPDPLGNFVLEDPGFGELELGDPDNGDSDSNDDMFADRQHLMENPALKGRNPYASPTASGQSGNKGGPARKLRQSLLKHEEAVKALGVFQMASGGLYALCGFAAIVMLMFGGASPESSANLGFVLAILAVMFLFSIAIVFVGWNIFRLKTWAKICATVFLVPGLLGFPLGTAISGYFLWLLHSEKGKQVFSDEYRRAVKATPDMRTGKRLIIILAALPVILMLGAIILGIVMGLSSG